MRFLFVQRQWGMLREKEKLPGLLALKLECVVLQRRRRSADELSWSLFGSSAEAHKLLNIEARRLIICLFVLATKLHIAYYA